MSSTTKTTKTNAKSIEAKSGQKRKLDEAAEVLSAPDTPKALWSSPVGPRSSGLSHRCSDFQNKFKEPIFDELRDPVDMANNSKPVLGRIESAGAVDLRVSTGDALAPPTLAQVSSTRSVSIGCNGNNINTHADSSTVRSEPDHSPVINAGTPSPRPEPASTFSYNGPTFGVQMTAPLKLTSTASFGSGVKTDPLNPWYLSQGIPNFAKNAKASSIEESERARKRLRRTPDIISQIGSNAAAGTCGKDSGTSPRAVMTSMLDEEKEKAKRLENVLLSALLPK